MAKEDVVFKGTKEGILIRLNDEQPYEALVPGLVRRLKAAERFFQGARVTLDVGSLRLSAVQEAELVELITQRFGLELTEVARDTAGEPPEVSEEPEPSGDESPFSDDALRAVASSVFQGPAEPAEERRTPGETLLVKRTLRSGQRVWFNGNIVILGDVNPGAEVVARGDVVVLGRLRGMVHAGAMGDDRAIVAAVRLQPTQLRISRQITRPPDDDGTPVAPAAGPEVAVIRDGSVVIDSYLTYDERTDLSELIRH